MRLIVLVLLMLASHTAGAEVEVIPAQGQPQAGIGVLADGLARSASYAIWLEGRSISPVLLADEVSSDANGTFSTQVTVPTVPVDSYDVVVRSSLGIAARVPFAVLAPLTLRVTPADAFAGDTLQLTLANMAGLTVEVRVDGVPLLGPQSFTGTTLDQAVTLPNLALGNSATVDIQATTYRGGLPMGATSVPFIYREYAPGTVEVMDVVMPTEPVRAGEPFTVSGRLVLPDGADPADFVGHMAWRAGDGTRLPINNQPILLAGDGSFSTELFAPTLLAGFPMVDSGGTTVELEFVYNNPTTGESGEREMGAIGYTIEQVPNFNSLQTFNLRVRSVLDAGIEEAIVIIAADVAVVPHYKNTAPIFGYDPFQELLDESASAGAALNVGISQISSAYDDLFASNELTGCPITLVNGLTDADGRFDFTFSTDSTIAELFAQASQQVFEQGGITNPSVVPENLFFTATVSALHKNFADNNGDGCAPRKFRFSYNYASQAWRYYDPVTMTFSVPFNPNEEQLITLGACEDEGKFVSRPLIPGLPPADPVNEVNVLGGFVAYGNRNGANLVINEAPRMELPYTPAVLGQVENVQLVLQGPTGLYIRPMPPNVSGTVCTDAAIHYGTDISELIDWPPGSYAGTIVAQQVLDQTPVSTQVQINIDEGSDWIADDQVLENRVIRWNPDIQRLSADEIPLFTDDASTPALAFDIPPLANDNFAMASLRESRTPIDTPKRMRSFGTAGTAASNEADSVTGMETIGEGSVPIGSSAAANKASGEITILDTAKIPIFRYVWGLAPIASATMGVDIRFFANLIYSGSVVFSDAAAQVSLFTKTTAGAEVDIFLDASIIAGLVKASAKAVATFELAMIFETLNNALVNNGPCFTFDLAAQFEASVGPCDFCVKATGTVPLLNEQTGSGCGLGEQRKGLILPPPTPTPVASRVALGGDGVGRSAMAFSRSDGNFQVELLQAGQTFSSQILGAGPGAMQPELAYFQANQFVLMWAESKFSQAQFDALDNDVTAAVVQQRIMYRVHDGNSFSPPQVLSDVGGEGAIRMTSCRPEMSGCPANGEILAVWERDVNGDYNRHEIRIMSARFNGTSWSAVQQLDPASTAKDSQPSPVYVNGEPAVLWVRNSAIVYEPQDLDMDGQPDGTTLNLEQRSLHYRFLDQPAGVLEVAEAPLGLASPWAAATPDGGLLVAFSLPEPGQNRFLGTRRMLRYVRARQCVNGSCQWEDLPYTDNANRDIFVERPRVFVDGLGIATTVFRQLGFSGDALPTDAPEVLMGIGGAASTVFQLPQLAQPISASTSALSADGVADVHVNAMMEPLSNSLMTASVQFNTASAKQLKSIGLKARAAPGVTTQGVSDEVQMMTRAYLPDFRVLEATPSAGYVPQGGTIELTVQVDNVGPPATAPVEVTAHWDAGDGLLIEAASTTLASLDPGLSQELMFSIGLPPTFAEDQARSLLVRVNPLQTVAEVTAENNQQTLTLGTLPPPTELVASTESSRGTIFLNWQPVSDPRVTGYRIYRQNGTEPPQSAGFSNVAGFADLEVVRKSTYNYWVVSMSNGLQESAPSATVSITSAPQDGVFRDSFESP